MNKKIIVIVAVLAVLIIGGVIAFFLSQQSGTPIVENNNSTSTLPDVSTSTYIAPQPTSTVLTLGTSQGSVTTTNFYQSADYVTADKQTVVLKDTTDFTISYNVTDSSFVISLLSIPLQAARQAAESAFLSSLGITQQSACKLSVYEGVPISVSDQYPGESFPLSFCGGPVSL